MDYAITVQDGRPAMGFDKADSIFNNIYLSLAVRRGSWFQNPGFGSRLHLLKKNTARAEALAEEYAKEAVQWLLDVGRATTIEIVALRDSVQDLNRLKLLVRAVQPDGTVVEFNHFVEVV